MGIHLELISHDDLFKSLNFEPTIVNDYNIESEEDKAKLNAKLYTHYKGETLDVVPQCECGHLREEDLVGTRCPICGDICQVVTERDVESLLWIAAPKGVSALINPIVWVVISKKFTFNGINFLEYLCDPLFKTRKSKANKNFQKLLSLNIPRGISFFVNNFDKVIDTLIEAKLFQGNKTDRQDFYDFINSNRRALFSQHLPIPSKLMFVTEENATGVFADTKTITLALNAVRTISWLENGLTTPTTAQRESRATRAINQISEYYKTFFKEQFAQKKGWFRKHIFGSRLHFSFRAVISLLTGHHRYDELHLPWSMSVSLFHIHLMNKLLNKHGMSHREATDHIARHTLQYCPLIDSIFQELIAEAPLIEDDLYTGNVARRGIAVIFQRNPTLTRLSAQLMYVTRIKTDVTDPTISMSVLVTPGFNADYDGDALNGVLVLDLKMRHSLARLRTHLGVRDLQNPRSISSFVKPSPPTIATMSNFLHGLS